MQQEQNLSIPLQTGVQQPEAVKEPPSRLTPGLAFQALWQDKVVFFAVCFVLLVIVCAIAAEWVSPHDPYQQAIRLRNKPPMTPALQAGDLPHVLGTDALGRDTLSRLIFGARISLAVSFATVLVSGSLGVTMGLLAGYYRGRLEDIIMRVVDLQMSLPSLLLALFVLFALGPGFQNIILVLAITRWMVYCRLTRSLMLTLRESAFVEAARTIGCSDRRIVLGHMVPNLMSPVLVLGTLEIAAMMLTMAALDFLGLGIQPPDSSWGLMLAQGREYLTSAWWQVTFPGLAILFTALGFNLLATWVRGITDPVQSWRWIKSRHRKASASASAS